MSQIQTPLDIFQDSQAPLQLSVVALNSRLQEPFTQAQLLTTLIPDLTTSLQWSSNANAQLTATTAFAQSQAIFTMPANKEDSYQVFGIALLYQTDNGTIALHGYLPSPVTLSTPGQTLVLPMQIFCGAYAE